MAHRQFLGIRPREILDIQPGMTASIGIEIGGNTLLHYLNQLVTKTLDESPGTQQGLRDVISFSIKFLV